ncbi:hypothetical protein CKA32_004760 [Geitlerinema sp. FC II]|nr:hypothetical protein CKA32_004760 [Geitlerinema sp. FC II]
MANSVRHREMSVVLRAFTRLSFLSQVETHNSSFQGSIAVDFRLGF